LNFRQKLKLFQDRISWNHSNQKAVGDMYHKILVPLDGSKRADRILPHVEDLARRYKAKVIFLQVVENKAITTPEGAFINFSDQEFDQAKKRAETHLSGIQGQFREKNIESRTHVVYGPVVHEIISMAAQEGADLIALASHGHGGLSRVFYGSVAAGLLHRVDRPLLIIRSRTTE
jgi:nucleotide-binding universal stress UspA family protein